jgi:2-hydroxychromene-2-carboxylate isomerase
VADPAIKSSLRQATDDAFAAGVTGVPTVAVNRRLFWGDDQLETAAAFAADPY